MGRRTHNWAAIDSGSRFHPDDGREPEPEPDAEAMDELMGRDGPPEGWDA